MARRQDRRKYKHPPDLYRDGLQWNEKKKGAANRRINLCSDVKVYKDGKLLRTESKWKGKKRSG